MRRFIKQLEVPLYDNMKNIQFHDTLNGIIGAVYTRMHKALVEERAQRIATKLEIGEKLVGLEAIRLGSEAFWELTTLEQEEFLQATEAEF